MRNLSMHLLDILQNSVVADATLIEIRITDSISQNLWQMEITDNGKGMNEEILKKVVDPFFTSRTTRKVGLGIPLLKQNCERTGGSLKLESREGVGTKLTAQFILDNIDRPVVGDLAGTIVSTVSSYPNIEFVYAHATDGGEYSISTTEIKEAIDGTPISNASIIKFLKEMIAENLAEIKYSE